jgi:hypothetical protein
MKVKLLANLGTMEFPDTPYKDGDIHAVPKKLGDLLVKRHLAVVVEEEEPVEAAASLPSRKKPADSK